MALRKEELQSQDDAVVYTFPISAVRGRARARVRRRRAGSGVVVAAVIGLTLLGGGIAPASKSRAPRSVVVESGATLWDLAERYAPDGMDVRAYVDAVVELNDLGGRPPVAGERIRLPK